jgi:hypothetical protein
LDSGTDREIVIKLIGLGDKGSEWGSTHEKMIEKEIKIGLMIAKESKFVVSYLDIFEWEDYFCIKMEYCILGDLEHQLNLGKIFTEEV